MKKLIYLLIMALPLFLASCNNDDMVMGEETVEVSFRAELPQVMGTRAASSLTVDKVYCAVFEQGVEVANLRASVNVVEGQEIKFTPRLIKGRTYRVVFWAAKEGAYNVDDMTAITRNPGKPEADYDAFTATTEITVMNTMTQAITLMRPLAQLNMGVTTEDWKGMTTLAMTPTGITLSLNAKDTFNALAGEAVGEDKEITYNLNVSGEEFTCLDNTYKKIAMCYVMMDATQQADKTNVDIRYTITDQKGAAIRSDVSIYAIPLQSNYKTNVVGGLLTGTVTYTISLDSEWNTQSTDIYAVATAEDLVQAFQSGGDVSLIADIAIDGRLYVEAGTEVHLDMNGQTIESSADYVFVVWKGGTLVIDGNGTVQTETPAPVIFYPEGNLVIENGTFIRNIPEGYTGDATSMFVGTKPGGWESTGVTIKGGYFDGGYYDSNAADVEDILNGTKELEETEDDITKRGVSGDKNKVRVALKANAMKLFNRSNNYFKIYGGTFVGANPAWGDEGCMLPTTPAYLRPWSYYQGPVLDGQKFNENGIVLPEGYAITKGTTEDGRPTYTVTYSK